MIPTGSIKLAPGATADSAAVDAVLAAVLSEAGRVRADDSGGWLEPAFGVAHAVRAMSARRQKPSKARGVMAAT
jgi:hypothetical protein